MKRITPYLTLFFILSGRCNNPLQATHDGIISQESSAFLHSIEDKNPLKLIDFIDYGNIMDSLAMYSKDTIQKDVFLNLDWGLNPEQVNDSLRSMQILGKISSEENYWCINDNRHGTDIRIIIGGNFFRNRLSEITLLIEPVDGYAYSDIHHLKVIAYEYFLSQLCSGKRLKSENEEQNYNAVSYTGNIKYNLYYSIDGIRFDITDMFQAKIRKDSIRTEYLNKMTSEQ